MKNLFKDIKFGDKFLTRGGKVAIFLHKVGDNGYLDKDKKYFRFGTELETFSVNQSGRYWDNSKTDDCLDIVSKYKESFNEELEKIAPSRHQAQDYLETEGYLDENGYFIDYVERAVQIGFEWGYKKAREE